MQLDLSGCAPAFEQVMRVEELKAANGEVTAPTGCNKSA